MADRDSQSGEIDLVTDPDAKARIEAANALQQTKAALDLLPAWIAGQQKLRPSLFLRLHGILLDRISAYPGVFRPGPMTISNSQHTPPPSRDVPLLMEELCDYVNENWSSKSSLHLAAYILWRTNWIHPFADGNGRTARIVSYLILCAHTQTELPGTPTIPEQIATAKAAYCQALEDADLAFRRGALDVTELESVLESCLAQQLISFLMTAGGRGEKLDEATRAEIQHALEVANASGLAQRDARPLLPARRPRPLFVAHLERYPVVYGAIVTIAVAVIGWIFFR
jgi:Fic family protein